MRRSELSTACQRQIRRLEGETGRICRKIGVVVPRKGDKYVYGAFVSGRHDRTVFTIGFWEESRHQFIPA